MANRLLRPDPFVPVASPVDRFRQPAAGRMLSELAQGLSRLAPSLSRLGDVEAARDSEEQQLEGEAQARAWREEGLTYKQAIEQGKITPDQSPWFRMGAQEFFGRNAASDYRDFLSRELANSPVAESTEVEDFDKFESETRQRFVDEVIGADNRKRSQAFEQSFGREVDQLVSTTRGRFAEAAGGRTIKEAQDAVAQRVMSLVTEYHMGGISPGLISGMVEMEKERAIAMGMDKGRVARTVAQSVINAAKSNRDTELLSILERVTTGPGGTVATLPDVAQAILEAEQSILQDIDQRATLRIRAEDRALEERREQSMVTAARLLEEDPSADLGDLRTSLLAEGDLEGVQLLYGLTDAYQDRMYQEDPAVRARAYLRLHGMDQDRPGYLSQRELASMLASRQISTGTYTALSHEITNRDSMAAAQNAESRAWIARGESRIRGLFVAEFGGTVEQRVRANSAVSAFVQGAVDLRNRLGREPTEEESNNFIMEQSTQLFAVYGSPLDTKVLNSVPSANAAPGRADWRTQKVAEGGTVNSLQNELNAIANGTRNSLSAQYQQILRAYNVGPGEIQEFIEAQRGLQR